MKQWYKVLAVSSNSMDDTVNGFDFIEAGSAEEAEKLIYQSWVDDEWEYKDLYIPKAELADWRDVIKLEKLKAVQLFMKDNCTKAEAERHIKNGSEAVKVADWAQYAEDNDLRNENNERLTLDEIRSERDVHTVKCGGEEYLLLYVL